MTTVREVLEYLRRLEATGVIDQIVVVAAGPDPGVLIHIGSDFDREGDLVRLSGGLHLAALKIDWNSLEAMIPGEMPGPRSTDG